MTKQVVIHMSQPGHQLKAGDTVKNLDGSDWILKSEPTEPDGKKPDVIQKVILWDETPFGGPIVTEIIGDMDEIIAAAKTSKQ